MLNAQDSPEEPPPAPATDVGEADSPSVSDPTEVPDGVPLEPLLEIIDEKSAQQTESIRQQLDAWRAETTPADPSFVGTWVSGALLLLVPLALWMVARQLGQRLDKQGGEMKHQRLQLEAMREDFQKLPGNLPRPNIDVARLADAMRPLLQQTHTSAIAQPASEPLPFYHDTPWLNNLAQAPLAYLRYLSQLRQEIGEIYRELENSEDPGEALALASWILCRFHADFDHQAAARWEQLWSVAQEEGYLCDRSLTSRLDQAHDQDERGRTLGRAFYRDVLELGISQHLVLLEEMRQLPNFSRETESHEACQSVSRRAATMLQDFLTQTRDLAGYTPNYVPLFTEISDDSAHFVRNNGPEHLPIVYRHLDQPRRRVLCVLSYGLRRDRGWENEETQVILS